MLRAAIEPLPEWASDALELAPEVSGVTLVRLRRVDGDLVLYGENHLPNEYAGILSELWGNTKASLYGTLREVCGVEVAGSRRMLEAVTASASLARILEVPSGFPLVYIQSVTRDAVRARLSTATGLGCAPISYASPSKQTTGRS